MEQLSDIQISDIRNNSGFQAALVFSKSVANQSRLSILAIIATKGRTSVAELKGMLKLSHSSLSRNLSALTRSNLIYSERQSKLALYYLNPKAFNDSLVCLGNVLSVLKSGKTNPA